MTDQLTHPTTAGDTTVQPPHVRTQATGLVLVASAAIVLLIAGLITGLDLGEVVGFLLLPAIVLVAAAALTVRFGTWATVLGLVVTLMAGALWFWMAFGIFEPAAFVDFIAGVTFTVGFLLALVGGIAAIVKRKAVGPSPNERRIARIAVAIVGLAVLISVPTWLVSRQTVSAEEAAGATPVVAHDFAFTPGDLQVASGTTLLVQNDDAFLHTFTIDTLGIDVDLLPGDEVLVTIDAGAGSYVFYCQPHTMDPENPELEGDEADMAGTLVVD